MTRDGQVQSQAQEWISVKDRLPEHGESVLTYKNGIVDIQMYEKNRNGWISDNWFWSMATVTHWMPIPATPEVEGCGTQMDESENEE